ncbi:hypothetical protein GGQ92_001258 [Gracilibacillus halotolerans]|uniref:Uncharacterized protein n=1 Tax=Gracilibacillus halotolerans TaxID=74386 RepID=A0A841RMT2_9BACI|nr:hypothetical protein [Gracilibacillus halotolerans]MBB6512475.1 hypothetical protein [Gracilibacillus halotolerans]
MKHIYIFFSFVFVLHILSVFYPSTTLSYVLGSLSLIILLISFWHASRLFQTLAGGFLAIGIFLFFFADLRVLEVIPFLGENISLLTLLAVLPWMNSVVHAGRFDRLMSKILKGNVKHLGSLYRRSTTTMMALTAFLNVSSATIARDVLADNLKSVKERTANQFIMMVTLRGYSLALAWSPLEVLLAMSIFITGVSFSSLLPWMIGITLLMYILDSLWGNWFFKKVPYVDTNSSSEPINLREIRPKLIQLSIALISFLLLVILFGNVFDMEFIFIVTLLVFPFACIWAWSMKRWRSFWKVGFSNWKSSVNNMHNFNILFISLALFTNTLNASPFLDWIQQPILAVADYPILLLILIQIFFVLMSMFGVHPIATMGILGGMSGLLMEILSPMSLAVILVVSGVATVPIGTYGLVVTIISMSLKQSPYLITLYNLIYSFVFGLFGILLAYYLI